MLHLSIAEGQITMGKMGERKSTELTLLLLNQEPTQG